MDSSITYQVFEKGSTLYEADEKAEFLYTMHYGDMKLLQVLPTGEHRIVRLPKRGDLAGIEAVRRFSVCLKRHMPKSMSMR